jgi:tetratricopeptide (TPR) repeat protein
VIKKELKKAKISNSIFQLLTTSAGRMFKRAGITVTGNDFTITYRISPDVGEIDHLMIIGKMNKDGEVMCYDVMSLTKGDTYSSIFAEMIASNPGLTSELPEWNEHYRLMVESERMGNFSTAIEYYDKLPKNIQSLRLTQMIYLRIAEAHSELKFNSAAINFVKTYNDNDSLSLYNGLLMLKIGQCEKAMYYFEKADSALLGGDSFTNVYRAHVSNCLGDYQGALTYLGQVEDMQTYKNSESITTARMEALIGLSEFDEATLYLPALFQSLGVETPNDELVKLIYPSLYESTEFKEWYSNQAL